MKKPTPAILTLAAFTIAGLAGCTGSSDPTTSTSTSSSIATSSSTTSTTSSSSTSTTADGTQQAQDVVIAFYKEMDQLGKGKLDINKITTWTTFGTDGKDTVAKWSNSVGELVYGRKLTQVGDTEVSDLSSKEIEPPKSNFDYAAAYEVTACVDRSRVTFEDATGKPVDVDAGVAAKTLVTHLLVAHKDMIQVARDTPGKSC